jgi:hypothetical protein
LSAFESRLRYTVFRPPITSPAALPWCPLPYAKHEGKADLHYAARLLLSAFGRDIAMNEALVKYIYKPKVGWNSLLHQHQSQASKQQTNKPSNTQSSLLLFVCYLLSTLIT